jgi:hypothetical protein
MRMGSARNGHGGGCALCSGPTRRKHRAEIVVICTRCGRGICLRHGRWSEQANVCVACLRAAPTDIQRAALRVG